MEGEGVRGEKRNRRKSALYYKHIVTHQSTQTKRKKKRRENQSLRIAAPPPPHPHPALPAKCDSLLLWTLPKDSGLPCPQAHNCQINALKLFPCLKHSVKGDDTTFWMSTACYGPLVISTNASLVTAGKRRQQSLWGCEPVWPSGKALGW